MTNNTLQATVNAIRANMEAIKAIRATAKEMPIAEAAEILLIERYHLSQGEAHETVEQLAAGLADYKTQRAAAENSEDFIKERINSAVESLSPEDRITALSRVLAALVLASNKDVTESEIAALVNANASLSEEELVDAIAEAYQGLNIESLIGDLTNDFLDPEMVKKIGDAADLNNDDFRLAAALQLYIAQREGILSLSDDADAPQIDPTTLGAMAGAGIDAYVAAVDLHEGRITLEKWQRITKWILGALFAVAFGLLVIVALAYSLGSIVAGILSILGTGFFVTLLTVFAMITVISWSMEYAVTGGAWLMEKLSPIYDKVIVKLTEWFNIAKEKVAKWVESSKNWVVQKTTSTNTNQTQPAQDNRITPATVNVPAANPQAPTNNLPLLI